MKAVVDETTPEGRGGIYYVVAAAIVLSERDIARERVRGAPWQWPLDGNATGAKP